MRYLSSPSVTDAQAAIEAELPGMKISSLRLGQQGWDNFTFVLNEEWIVRFPKDGSRWTQERWVMSALQGLSPVAIPRLEMEGTSIAFMGHRLLPGVQLSEAWGTFSPEEREAAIERAVEFFAAMHCSLDVDEAKAHAVALKGTRFEHVRASLEAGGEWAEAAGAAMARVDAGSPKLCVLHNDLHGDNILVDPEKHEVTGVIDFGDVAYGDPAIDLNYLCEFDLYASERIARRYAECGAGAVDPHHILDLYFLLTLDEYLDPNTPSREVPVFRKMLDEYVAVFRKAK